jgi:hypothetical protein
MSHAPTPVLPGSGEELSPELKAYYADTRRRMINVVLILFGNWGGNIALGIATTLSILQMKRCGVSVSSIALMSAVNFWAVSFLVMYFSWRSDHTVSRLGRRIPYTLISMPFLVVTTALFPYIENPVSLIILYMVKYLFLDLKGSTWALVLIDCVPRDLLGRLGSIQMVLGGISGYFIAKYALPLADRDPHAVFLLAAAMLLVSTTLACVFVKEPPVRNPTTEPFRPWSAIAVGWRDRRILLLMLGVAMISGFYGMYGSWAMLWQTNTDGHGLGLTLTEMGEAGAWVSIIPMLMALPVGWIIDKMPGLRAVILYYVIQMGCFAYVVTQVNDLHTLIFASFLLSLGGGLYTAADIMVWRNFHPRDIGSATSSNSFVRNMYQGCFNFAGGLIIVVHGADTPNYVYSFIFGAAMCTIGMAMFVLHAWVMRRGRGRAAATAAPLEAQPPLTDASGLKPTSA